MKKLKMALISVIILILTITSVTPNDAVEGKTEPKGEIPEPPSLPNASPTFQRTKKEPTTPSSPKMAVPKLTVNNDEDIFWEVTKTPSDFVDGNHPDVREITTHDHVDKTIGKNPQTKRVKKILPPFEAAKKEDEGIKRNARNTEKSRNETDSSRRRIVVDESINIQNAFASSSAATNLRKNSTDDPETTQFTTSRETKDVDVAPDLKNSKTTPLSPFNKTNEGYNDETTPSTDNVKGDKIQNPEFLFPLPNFEAELIKVESSSAGGGVTTMTTTIDPDYSEIKDGGEIEGIRLVPKEFGMMPILLPKAEKPAEYSTTHRSIWDLLKEREKFNSELKPTASSSKTTSKSSLFKNFDADSAEIEYETENFQHGYSNIEKHELPFSYALPWLEIKDKEFDVVKKEKKPVIHTKINDFPSILPINKNHFDGNQEQEIPRDLSKLLKLSPSDNSGVTVSIVDSGTNNDDYSRYGHRPSKWYLLLLTGNSTIVKLRRKDFTKYLKLNLAARLSVEFDDIKVNKVILAPPKVLVNISVYEPSDDIAEESQFDMKEKFEEAPLYKLARTNATLLELSGEEYHVVRFLSLQSQKPEIPENDPPKSATKHDDLEFVVYTFLGSACACAVILTIFIALSKYFKKLLEYDWPWNRKRKQTKTEADEFNGISPAVIYSGGFPQIRGSWMTGSGSRNNQESFNYSQSILRQYPGIELGVNEDPDKKNPTLYPELENRNHRVNSPRHNKLQIYKPGANNLVIPLPPQKEGIGKGKFDKYPLDVRITDKTSGRDNPNFTN